MLRRREVGKPIAAVETEPQYRDVCWADCQLTSALICFYESFHILGA